MDTQLPKQTPQTSGTDPASPPTTQPDQSTQSDVSTIPAVAPSGPSGKEREIPRGEQSFEVAKTAEELVPLEVKEAGVEIKPETIELPPDLTKLGARPSGATQPVIHQGGAKATVVTVPLSDPQIVTGLHASILSSLRWLAEWCILQLKRAHIQLRIIKGKIFRVSIKEIG